MDGKNFCEGAISFILLILSICLFHTLGIELNFITMFLLTIFTIGISIFFYRESINVSTKIIELVGDVQSNVKEMRKERGIAENLYTPSTFLGESKIKGWYTKK